jgi:geranylgeranyl diphosphate synthase type I
MNPEKLFLRYNPELGIELRSIIGDSSLPLYHLMRYHLGWVDASGNPRPNQVGKLLRPGLCLLACESVGGDWRVALPAAAALELMHNFTLIHDDIEDEDRERRGMPTVWHVWGKPQAVNTGDAMHVLARLSLLGLEHKGVSLDKVLRAARLLDAACLCVCEGQYLDISYEERLDIGIEDYLEMIGGKTAALFSCSLEIGSLLGTSNESTINHMAEFGRSLGMAFQIQDDILGIWGQNKVTGKPTTSDIRKKKKTLPVIYGIHEAASWQKAQLLRIYRQKTVQQSDVALVLRILDSVGAQQYARAVANRYCEEALQEVKKADISLSSRDEFASLTEFIIGRGY